MNYTGIKPNQDIYQTGIIYDVHSLFAFLMQVNDPRYARGKQYLLVVLLVLMISAKLCGENMPTGIAEWVAYWVEALVAMKLPPGKKSALPHDLSSGTAADRFAR